MAKKRNIKNLISSKDSYFEDLDSIENEQSDISDVVKKSMFEYGSYIIEERALPNMLDGLKPVQRRSLYAMKAGNMVGSKHYKLARVVGDVIGKYHPHGDSSVVGTIVQMVNKWKNNFPFLIGQGNWGSITGDSNAAMRYIEVKLDDYTNNILFDSLEKENVIPWIDNYDATTQEPRLLPLKFPFHLLNGTSGIAYGMATDIPSYNVKEMTNLMIYLIENSFYTDKYQLEDHKEAILNIIPSVDFPTGTNIYFDNNKNLEEDSIFQSKFSLRMRASYELDENKNEITIYNIPINVKTNKLKEEILNAKRSYREINKRKQMKEPTEILNINESPLMMPEEDDASIILSFKRDADLTSELAKLFKYTSLDKSFSANIRVINEEGVPVDVSFYDNMIKFLEFRQHVVFMSIKHDIKKLAERIHLLEGFRTALDNIDKVIEIIRGNKDSEEAQKELQSEFGLSEAQTKGILEMKLSRLTGLESEKIDNELSEKNNQREVKEEIISCSANVYNYIKEDYLSLLETKQIKNNTRRSKILSKVTKFSEEDLIKDKEVIVMLMSDETISYIPSDKFKLRNRGAQSQNSKVNASGYDNMNLEIAERCNLKDEILLISSFGKAFKMKAYKISTKFNYVGNILNLEKDEKIIFLSKYDEDIKQYLLLTQFGKIKGLNSSIMKSVTDKRSTTIVQLDTGDSIQSFSPFKNTDNENVLIAASDGKVLKFPTNNVGILKGGNTKGSRGIDLNENTKVVKMRVSDKETDILIAVSDIGKAKKVLISEIPTKKRGQKPNVFFNQDKANGQMIGAEVIEDEAKEALMILTEKGDVTLIKIADFNQVKRSAKGAVKIMNIKSDKAKLIKKIEIEE
jgi:DNA gyrase subunit A